MLTIERDLLEKCLNNLLHKTNYHVIEFDEEDWLKLKRPTDPCRRTPTRSRIAGINLQQVNGKEHITCRVLTEPLFPDKRVKIRVNFDSISNFNDATFLHLFELATKYLQ